MLFFYIRHGDPVYNPDSLTPLGQKQAEALSKRLSHFGLDRIFTSTSTRAKQTAQPTCDLLKLDMTELDFCNEKYAFRELGVPLGPEGHHVWLFAHDDMRVLLTQKHVRDFGFRWYDAPEFAAYPFKEGMERIYDGMDELFLSLGYEHERYTGRYKIVTPNKERVALFAHQGFGIAFLSCLLDIPYPEFSLHFDLSHSSMTVIDFRESNGYAIPQVLTLSSDSHIYSEGLPTAYNNKKHLRF